MLGQLQNGWDRPQPAGTRNKNVGTGLLVLGRQKNLQGQAYMGVLGHIICRNKYWVFIELFFFFFKKIHKTC